jgi:hypothetical protein
MTARDKIRLTGLLRRGPATAGLLYIAVLVSAVLVPTGCGDDSEAEPVTAQSGKSRVGISAASDEDQAIADDLWEYVKRGCQDFGPPPDSQLEPAIERALVRRYGSVQNAFESAARACESYERVGVEDRVITVSTVLAPDEQGELDADHICNAIQGSDVADMQTHEILDADGELLLSCRGAGP